MTTTPAHQLEQLGQSVWLDTISRDMLRERELERLVTQRGVLGVTSNPSIFATALKGSATYDDDIARLHGEGRDDREIFTELAVADIRDACDVLLPVHERTTIDGMVSIEIEPDLADDTEASIERGRELWRLVDRPNVMIKVPATDAGLPVIEQLLFEGVNVNVTLLFAVSVYREVMDRYLRALERRHADGRSLDTVHSVASFFVSRVDSSVDEALEQAGAPARLQGTAAVANAVVAWDACRQVFDTPRFHALRDAGGRVQRPLWASTSTKNPRYPDTLYVQELIAPGTVNTMPLETLDAFIDHGEARVTITDPSPAYARLAEIRQAGVDFDAITEQLRLDGVRAFADAFTSLLDGLSAKRATLAGAG